MKRAVKLFFVALVGLIVFTGGLCIAQGIREGGGRSRDAGVQRAETQLAAPGLGAKHAL